MAAYHGYDGVLTINSVDLSDWCTDFEIVESYGDLDTTAAGDTHETRIGGLGSFVLTATFHQDQAANAVYATLQPLVGTVTTFTGKASSAATAATNVQVGGSIFISEFSYMHPAPGTLDTFSVSWAGSGSLTITTS